jgi:hypothetical protein
MIPLRLAAALACCPASSAAGLHASVDAISAPMEDEDAATGQLMTGDGHADAFPSGHTA